MEPPRGGALIPDALYAPANATSYSLGRWLALEHPKTAILETASCSFDLNEYLRDGRATAQPNPEAHAQLPIEWLGFGKGFTQYVETAWLNVQWEAHSLEVVTLNFYESAYHKTRISWILSDVREIAERFFVAVCEWCAEIRGEVLVFDGGRWHKSEALFQSIQDATFDNLILPGDLKAEIQGDFEQFFASHEAYERYRVPWKRGVLLIGPPGNGKTHTVKALINYLGQPCLYVKSFKQEYGTDHDCIRNVFKRARQTTPCILVLEDLDSLIDGKNRSFFLNELDGFAANTGVVVLATTNHPERLDPAILDRPSRFDRKYHFDLPAPTERRAYISRWSGELEPVLRLSGAGIERLVAATDGFSYAYLKELFLSSIMRWIHAPRPGAMDALMADQVETLREQMTSHPEEPMPDIPTDEEREEED